MAVLKYDHRKRLLDVTVWRAPGRRAGSKNPRAFEAVHAAYRKELWAAAQKARIPKLNHQIKVSARFINPETPDLDNLIVALFRALDGKTGDESMALLGDDGQIVGLKDVDIWFQ
jgi:hypothetical protein